MKQSVCCLTVPNNLEYIPVVLDYVRSLARMAGFEASEYTELEIATEEAVSNVITHAFAPGEQSSYDVRCEIRATGMLVAVCDRGIPFDPSRIAEYNPAKNLDDLSTTGLGSYLIKNLVDQVEYCNLGPAGKEVRLLKYLPSKAITEQAIEIQAEIQNVRREKPAGQLQFRAMLPTEATEVSRCFFEAYGYSYVYEDIYFPERLVALNKSGELLSMVAVNENNEVLSHAAMLFAKHLPGIAELAMGATRPRFQGNSIVQKLVPIMFAEAARRQLKGLYSHTICAHTYSQRIISKAGFKETAFLLAHCPESSSIKGIAEQMPARGSAVVYYFSLQREDQSHIIYPPSQHQEIILDIYNNLGTTVTVGDPLAADILSGETEVDLTINKRRQTAVLSFNRYGEDVFDRIRDVLYRIKIEKVLVLEAFLNLYNPHTSNIATHLEKWNFLFTGFIPGADGGDRLVMQYFNGIVVNYDMINLYSEQALNLLNYIRKNDPLEVPR
ncbi:MAG: ATP-binding protein [Syntrophomonas sp.]